MPDSRVDDILAELLGDDVADQVWQAMHSTSPQLSQATCIALQPCMLSHALHEPEPLLPEGRRNDSVHHRSWDTQ